MQSIISRNLIKSNFSVLPQNGTRQISSVNLTVRSSPQVIYKASSPSEEEIRRYVVGLATMKNGMLRPVTSKEQVVQHFSTNKPDTIQNVLQRKTKVLQSKSGHSILEWIY